MAVGQVLVSPIAAPRLDDTEEHMSERDDQRTVDPDVDGPTTETDERGATTPVDRGGALPPTDRGDDPVEEASEESFPASDPPTYSRFT